MAVHKAMSDVTAMVALDTLKAIILHCGPSTCKKLDDNINMISIALQKDCEQVLIVSQVNKYN